MTGVRGFGLGAGGDVSVPIKNGNNADINISHDGISKRSLW